MPRDRKGGSRVGRRDGTDEVIGHIDSGDEFFVFEGAVANTFEVRLKKWAFGLLCAAVRIELRHLLVSSWVCGAGQLIYQPMKCSLELKKLSSQGTWRPLPKARQPVGLQCLTPLVGLII